MPTSAKPKGKPRGGSRKGRPNKLNKAVKDMVLAALDKAGGEKYLLLQAMENPVAFMTLVGKLIPAEVKQEVTGKNGGPVQHHNVTPEELAEAVRSVREEF